MCDDMAVVDDVPDWSAIAADICCPLCGYNLRGLAEPRCPECGYGFAWAAVLAPPPTHPYLFECHPRRNGWAFLRTQLGGCRPRHFWRTLQPEVRVRPVRLLVYWIITAGLFLVATSPKDARDAVAFFADRAITRARIMAPAYTSFPALRASALQTDVPPWYTAAFVEHLFRYGQPFGADVAVAGGVFCWPWVTFSVLQVFAVSIRRAHVRQWHVVRCVLYSCDFGLLAGLAIAVLLWPPSVRAGADEVTAVYACLPLVLYVTYRLGTAYHLYLRFHRPYLTAVASQAIVFLIALKASYWLAGY